MIIGLMGAPVILRSPETCASLSMIAFSTTAPSCMTEPAMIIEFRTTAFFPMTTPRKRTEFSTFPSIRQPSARRQSETDESAPVEGRNLVPYSGIHRRLRAEDGISDVFVLHHQAVAVILKYRAVLQHKAVEAVHTDGKRAAVEALLDEITFEMVKSLCRKRGDGLNKRVAAYHVHSESRILPLPRGIVQVNAVGSASVGGIDDKLGGGRLVLRSRRCDDCHVPAGFRVRIDDLSEIDAAYRVGVGEDHIIGIFLLKEGERGAELLDFPAIAPGISRRKGRNEHKSAALAVEIPVLTGAEMVYQRLIVVFRDDPDVVYSGVDHVGEDKIYLTVSPGEGSDATVRFLVR